MHSYVSQATHAFLGILPLCFLKCCELFCSWLCHMSPMQYHSCENRIFHQFQWVRCFLHLNSIQNFFWIVDVYPYNECSYSSCYKELQLILPMYFLFRELLTSVVYFFKIRIIWEMPLYRTPNATHLASLIDVKREDNSSYALYTECARYRYSHTYKLLINGEVDVKDTVAILDSLKGAWRNQSLYFHYSFATWSIKLSGKKEFYFKTAVVCAHFQCKICRVIYLHIEKKMIKVKVKKTLSVYTKYSESQCVPLSLLCN